MTTRERIKKFNLAFGRPVNTEVVTLTPEERVLLGKLILEECVEYLTKGLGLQIGLWDPEAGVTVYHSYDAHRPAEERCESEFRLEPNEGQEYDPVESADGLGDMNVAIHFNSHWHGFNLDAVTEEIDDSNMSKLLDGRALINGVTIGYRPKGTVVQLADLEFVELKEDEDGFDPSKPVGKILKGPNYRAPDIARVIFFSGGNH